MASSIKLAALTIERPCCACLLQYSVGSQNVQELLEHLDGRQPARALVLTSQDRTDLVLSLLAAHGTSGGPHIAGMLLTAGRTPGYAGPLSSLTHSTPACTVASVERWLVGMAQGDLLSAPPARLPDSLEQSACSRSAFRELQVPRNALCALCSHILLTAPADVPDHQVEASNLHAIRACQPSLP